MEKLEVIALIFTNRCNLNCVFCGRKEDGNAQVNELPLEFWLKVCKDAKEMGVKRVNVTGGEIFIRKDIHELIRSLIKDDFIVTIESNGTLIKDEDIEKFKDYGKNFSISVSLDGADEKTHDSARGEGNFDKTMRTLQKISEASLNARVITVLTKENYKQIPLIVKKVYEDLHLGFRLLPNIIEYGKGIEACDEYGVEFKKIEKLLNEFYYEYLRKDDSNKLSVELNMALMPIDIENHSICPWGKHMLGIGENGNVSLCHVSSNDDKFIFGNLKTNSLREIWENNELLNKFRNMDENKLNGICGNCLARDVCRGGCRVHALTKYENDFYAPDPQCQDAYEKGLFPEYAMEDEKRDCLYL
ncbi:MAG: hypothetical protein A2Y22_02595 [Clostridiales bacterium GWD2_32_59]|nr:MAG: hypothetical protein A2Y22_02595 [Clostridiales bacterium GWD2_32_59]